MPTLQELLASRQPDKLQELLDSIRGKEQYPEYKGNDDAPVEESLISPVDFVGEIPLLLSKGVSAIAKGAFPSAIKAIENTGAKTVSSELPRIGSNLPATIESSLPKTQRLADDILGSGTSKSKFMDGPISDAELITHLQKNSNGDLLKKLGYAGLGGTGFAAGYLYNPEDTNSVSLEQPKGIGPVADASKYAQMLPQKEEEEPAESDDEEAIIPPRTTNAISNQDRINRLLASSDTVGTLDRLRAAQQRGEDIKTNADIMAQGAKFGANLAGAISKLGPAKADTEFADKLRQDSDAPVKQLGQQLEMEKDDPNSTYSKNFREFAKPLAAKAGIILPENMSARQISSVIPQLEKMYDSTLKRDELKIKREELAQTKAKAVEDKNEKNQNDFVFKASTAAKPIIDNYTKLYSAAKSAKSMTGKNPAEDVSVLYDYIKALDPASAVREGEVSLASSLEGLKGKAEVLMNKVNKGDNISTQMVNNLKKEILRVEQTGNDVYTKRMSVFKEQAKSRGLPESRFKEFDPFHETMQQSQQSSGYSEAEERGIARVMSSNNISREEAIKALKDAGKIK